MYDMRVRMCVRMCVHMCEGMCVHMCVSMCECMDVSMCVCKCVYNPKGMVDPEKRVGAMAKLLKYKHEIISTMIVRTIREEHEQIELKYKLSTIIKIY